MRRRLKTSSTLFTLAVLLLVAGVVSSGLGAVRVPFPAVIRALLHPSDAGDAGIILFTLRLPRVIAAGLVGAGLSATGVLFQGLFRNPLADPFVLGASGGAALGGAVAVFLVPTMSIAGISATAIAGICRFAADDGRGMESGAGRRKVRGGKHAACRLRHRHHAERRYLRP